MLSSATLLFSGLFGGKISIEDFFHIYYERGTIAVKRNIPSFFKQLLTFEEIESIIFRSFINETLIKSKSDYYNAVIPGHGTRYKLVKRILLSTSVGYWSKSVNSDNLTISQIYGAISRNYSLVFNKIQLLSPSIANMAAMFEIVIGRGVVVNANLYVTPSSFQQGFEAHYDWMDAIILQISGCKKWKIYHEQIMEYPRPDNIHHIDMNYLDYAKFDEFILTPGSVLYIPRGIIHEAATNCSSLDFNSTASNPSVHITFGVEVAQTSSWEILTHHFLNSIFNTFGNNYFINNTIFVTSDTYDNLEMLSYLPSKSLSSINFENIKRYLTSNLICYGNDDDTLFICDYSIQDLLHAVLYQISSRNDSIGSYFRQAITTSLLHFQEKAQVINNTDNNSSINNIYSYLNSNLKSILNSSLDCVSSFNDIDLLTVFQVLINTTHHHKSLAVLDLLSMNYNNNSTDGPLLINLRNYDISSNQEYIIVTNHSTPIYYQHLQSFISKSFSNTTIGIIPSNHSISCENRSAKKSSGKGWNKLRKLLIHIINLLIKIQSDFERFENTNNPNDAKNNETFDYNEILMKSFYKMIN
eukprot:gene6751-9252_t